jgi:phage baseplate assembly protein W
MSSLSVKLPLTKDSGNGFTMNKSIVGMIKQNFKMLLLTIPGERVMEPNFGVGLKTFLFSNYYEGVESQISQRIREQVTTYLPTITVKNIQFLKSNIDVNTLGIRITYEIPAIGLQDLLEFTI